MSEKRRRYSADSALFKPTGKKPARVGFRQDCRKCKGIGREC